MPAFYDPIEDAPVAAFSSEGGDTYAGAIARHEWVSDRYNSGEQIMSIALALDEPLDDCPYVTVMVRSAQMRRAIGRAYTAAGHTELVDGDWLSVACTGEEESQSGSRYKVYEAEYRMVEAPEPSIATGEFAEGGAYQPSLFTDDRPVF
jgi:hypothetical protein